MAFTFAGRYAENLLSTTGAPLANTAVTVRLPGTTTAAALWTTRAKTTAAANPVTSDSYGNLAFYADAGYYDLFANGVTLPNILVPVDTELPAPNGTYVAYVTGLDLTGATSSTTVLQAAIDAASAAGGGTLYIRAGTVSANVTVPSNVHLDGAGPGITVLKSVAGTNADVIKGANFAGLTNTLQGTPEAVGDNFVGISNMTIDGNKANNATAGYGIRLWGRAMRFENLYVQNCRSDGIWTEFSADVSTFLPHNYLEANFSNITCAANVGNGWTHRGPHDSILNGYVAFNNGGWAMQTAASANYGGGIGGTDWNSYLNTTGSFDFGSDVIVDYIAATGANVGTGIRTAVGSGTCRFGLATVAGHVTGVILRGTSHMFKGVVNSCTTGIQMGDGTGGVGLSIVDVTGFACTTGVLFTNENAGNIVRGIFQVDTGQVATSGSPSSQTLVSLAGVVTGGGTRTDLLTIPGAKFSHSGGYLVTLPADTGTLMTRGSTDVVANKSMGVSNTYRGLTVENDVKPSVTGSRGGNAALASLLTALANLGILTDSTTA